MQILNRFRPGLNSINSLNRLVEGASEAVGAADMAAGVAWRALRRKEGGFFAKITGTPEEGDPGVYLFQELYLDAEGDWQLLAGGRGTETGDVAVEVNALAGLAVGVRVWIQQWQGDGEGICYEFGAGSCDPFIAVVKDGGDAGNKTTQCTFTYTVKDRAGNILNKKRDGSGDPATGMTPARPRPAKGKMIATADDSYGIAFYDAEGNLVLWDAGEIYDITPCP